VAAEARGRLAVRLPHVILTVDAVGDQIDEHLAQLCPALAQWCDGTAPTFFLT